MMQRTTAIPDVSGGFYTVSEAARLLGMDQSRRIVRWLQPTEGGAEPIVLRDYPRAGREHEISFLDLMEIRFVEHFRKIKISSQSLRVAAKMAREELKVSHPFATSNVKFQTDRKAIFLETAKATGDRELLNLMTKQIAIYEVYEDSLARDLEFSIEGLARQWRPAPALAPRVIISPLLAFGQPVLTGRHVPTATLFKSWLANGHSNSEVADWFEIDPEDVEEAVRFELRPLH